jgi:hypothetical protein
VFKWKKIIKEIVINASISISHGIRITPTAAGEWVLKQNNSPLWWYLGLRENLV